MPSSSENQPRIAALLGASGATGQKLLPLLLADPAYGKVITVSRRESNIKHAKLENRIVDFDNLAQAFAGTRVDDCYCTFGTTIKIAGSQAAMRRIDHDYVLAFAQAGRAAGANRFAYLSAANANAGSPVFYARLKGETEDALKAMGFADLGIYRPSMIVAERQNRRLVESTAFLVFPLIEWLMAGPFTKYRSIRVEALARAIAAFSMQLGGGYQTHYWQDMMGRE